MGVLTGMFAVTLLVMELCAIWVAVDAYQAGRAGIAAAFLPLVLPGFIALMARLP
jgi:hypothetical protein